MIMNQETSENTTPVTPAITKPKKAKRRKKTVSDIEQQIKDLQQKKQDLIEKSKIEIGDLVLSTLDSEGIALEEIEKNKETVFKQLEMILKQHSEEISEVVTDDE